METYKVLVFYLLYNLSFTIKGFTMNSYSPSSVRPGLCYINCETLLSLGCFFQHCQHNPGAGMHKDSLKMEHSIVRWDIKLNVVLWHLVSERTFDIIYNITLPHLANHQIWHQATCKVGCQPGDRRSPPMDLQDLTSPQIQIMDEHRCYFVSILEHTLIKIKIPNHSSLHNATPDYSMTFQVHNARCVCFLNSGR